MIRTALIESGVVTNIVMHDPECAWTPPHGAVLVASETACVGDLWDGWVFQPAAPSCARARAAIHIKLAEIDTRSVRPLRAILDAQMAGLAPDPSDVATLGNLKSQADALRVSLPA